MTYPENDTEFQDKTIEKVAAQTSGWAITNDDGWSFFVPADSPVAPVVGMSCRMYGRGIGSTVRGLFLAGEKVFYRTAAEDAEHSEIMRYGAECADLLARWDAGRSVWSVEMGGMGPGYEQAIQITAFEILRHLVSASYDPELWEDQDVWKRDRAAVDKAVTPKIDSLGLSGAQWGAAMNIATMFYRMGPRAAMKTAPEDRKIQVSKNFPQLAA